MLRVKASISKVDAVGRILPPHWGIQGSYGLIDLWMMWINLALVLKLHLLSRSILLLLMFQRALRSRGRPSFLAAPHITGGITDTLAIPRADYLAVKAEDLSLKAVPPLDVVFVGLFLDRHALVEDTFEFSRCLEFRLVALVSEVRIQQLVLIVEGEDLRVKDFHLRVECGNKHRVLNDLLGLLTVNAHGLYFLGGFQLQLLNQPLDL